MRHIFLFLALLWLSAGFITCCAADAAEPLVQSEQLASDGVLHSAGDHDEVPADEHGNYPHHHKSCSGHAVSTASARIAAPGWAYEADQYHASRPISVAEAPPGKNLRPPIA